MFKDEARKSLLQKRKNLSQKECIKWDDLLLIQFQKLDFSNIHTYHGKFLPNGKVQRAEYHFIDQLLATIYTRFSHCLSSD